MQKLRPSDENEMVYEFLKMEITSERYAQQIEAVLASLQVSRDIIVRGDIASEAENAARREVLKQFRGYNDKELFENYPAKIDWVWAVFGQEELSKIIYINYSYWNELSNYTGSPLEAAKTILAGRTVYDVPNDSAFSGAEKLKKGHTFPPLIFLTDERESRYVILEGHGRMTAYGLAPEMFTNVSVLLGYCDSDALMKWYGEMPVL